MEPAPDDEEVFGRAWSSIKEGRGLKRGHPPRGRSLSWLVEEERIRTLEVTLLAEHGMTLPPETYPLRGIARDSQLSWRQKAVYHTRRRRTGVDATVGAPDIDPGPVVGVAAGLSG